MQPTDITSKPGHTHLKHSEKLRKLKRKVGQQRTDIKQETKNTYCCKSLLPPHKGRRSIKSKKETT